MFERFTKEANKVHMLALEEAARLGDRTVSSEHLLLGLLRQRSGYAACVLRKEGIDLASWRTNTKATTGNSELANSVPPWYERLFSMKQGEGIDRPFNEEAKTVLNLASDFAEKSNSNIIDTRELLLGILEMPNSNAVEILKRCGGDPAKIRESLLQAPVAVVWDAFPARRLIARGAFALVAIWLLLVGDVKSVFCLVFAASVMDLLEGYLDVFEEHRPVKTGIFESKLKYFLFWDGGAAIVLLCTRMLLPRGMLNLQGLMLFGVVLFLHLLSLNSSSRAGSRRAIKVERRLKDGNA